MGTVPDPLLQGFINEDRFFRLIQEVVAADQTPNWFCSLRRASALEDSLGVDGFAYVLNARNKLCRIPFQVKSSDQGIYRHYLDYQIFWMDRLPYFVINPLMADALILQKFFDGLRSIRLRNEVFRRVEGYLLRNGVEPETLLTIEATKSSCSPRPRTEAGPPSIHIAAE